VELVSRVAANINIPFTVGGGISSIEDVSACLNAGADKISVNSSAVYRPSLVDDLANEFGSQCVVVAIDSREIGNKNIVHTHGGRTPTDKETLAWAKEVQDRGAGEILLTSMDHDGTKAGFANELTALLSSELTIPIIASGGAGEKEHFIDAFTKGKADAALAASIFHYKEIPIPELKLFLKAEGIKMRIII